MTKQETVHSLEAARVREDITVKKAELKKNPADRVLELKIEDLETRVTRLDRDHKRVVDREQRREAAASQREQDAAAAEEAELRRQYTAAMPGDVSDAQWDSVRESVLHRHRLSQMDHVDREIAKAARRYAI